jgi:Zn-dependent protease
MNDPRFGQIEQEAPQRPTMSGSIPLFRLFGIQVFLHWSWFLIAVLEIQHRRNAYSTIGWNIAEYLALFAIVLMHEFGHSLACRSVGGKADRILLWPLGGAAFVQPPERPGAVLWSIAAGPLVNVILVPVTIALAFRMPAGSDVAQFLNALALINMALLVFNMLPIYPLDGGQILRALLWFVIGPARSLMIASVIGLIGAGIGMLLAIVWLQSFWLVIMAAFAMMQSWMGFQRAKEIASGAAGLDGNGIRRREGLRCPSCGAAPPIGQAWACPCGQPLDIFESQGICPKCQGMFNVVPCPTCAQSSPPFAWAASHSKREVSSNPV